MKRLSKELGLFDVYAISTGAMFSSGFFLLPGLAAAQTGPSVILAYFIAGVFILPAMLSVAELSTAMPRAGGAYYFLDRALGPMVGTVGGLGAWVALILKSAFALVGMGAYLALVADVAIKPVALALTALFAFVNIVGAKETSGLQRILVTTLVAILVLFVLQGALVIGSGAPGRTDPFSPFLTSGFQGLMATVGLVFVSYAGLTKVTSVAEEVRSPERNIPLGMALSLLTATVIYVAGVAVLVMLLEPSELRADLTPVATAARDLFPWLPGATGLVLIVVAAIAAFASTGNAGILSASRYPLAMARDRLLPSGFARLGRFETPTLAIFATALSVAAAILVLDVEGLAKLASAFILVLFAMLNLAVIVMRESGIDGYDPAFRSPLYPWAQVAGMLLPAWLIAEMGEMAVLFTLALIAACMVWYFAYARSRVGRSGAIYHAFERLGEHRFEGLDLELKQIAKEQALRAEDPYEVVVTDADVLDLSGPVSFAEVLRRASKSLSETMGIPAEQLLWALLEHAESGGAAVADGVALPHARLADVETPRMVLVRSRAGVAWPGIDSDDPPAPAQAIIVLVSSPDDPGRHLRLLGHLAAHVDSESFLRDWLSASGPGELRNILLREEHYTSLHVTAGSPAGELVGRRVADVGFRPGTLVALVRRGSNSFVPSGSTELQENDRLTVIGDAAGIRQLERRFEPPNRRDLVTVPPANGAGGGS